jgi:NAD(P)-dependent dehydrogenase (short-subunit alcohol dehydrogenase family)
MGDRRTVFITGAAGGIGRVTAQRFAREGWFVGLADVDLDALQPVLASIGADNGMRVELDVRDEAAWRTALAAFARQTGGRLDALINNAGVMRFDWFEAQQPADFAIQIDVNVKGVMLGAHAALPYLRATPGARLINIASQASLAAVPRLAAYSATKYAVRGLSEALDLEFMRIGVRVACVMPGIIDTPMLDTDDAKGRSFRASAERGGLIAPERVADAIYEAAHGEPLHYGVGEAAEQLAEPLREAAREARARWRHFSVKR